MLLHIFQIVKFLTIKAKYNVIEPYYMEGTTPDGPSYDIGPNIGVQHI
jgi:hypothetical protein